MPAWTGGWSSGASWAANELPASTPSTDVELILHAYRRWDTGCVDHLLGDFAFAIWDGRKQRLFCARDHFGVKPFFYARVGNALFSATRSTACGFIPA